MLIKDFDERVKKLKYSRYSVKVILSNSYENVFEIKKLFSKHNYQLVELKDFQENENSWFGISKLLEIINNLQKNSVVFGISEIVRFYSNEEFFIFFRSLFEIEDSNKNIFIPLFGLESRFNTVFFEKFHRKNEYNYIYKIDSKNEKYKLYVVDFDVPFDNQLKTIKDWLEFYKDSKNNLICSPKPLIYKAKNLKSDDLIQVYKISNQKEFIELYMNKKFPLEYKDEEKEYWNRLIIDLKNYDIEKLLKNRFNINSLTPSEVLKKVCSENDLYYKWLLKGYALLQEEDDYFYKIVKNSDINDELIEKIWFEIFNAYNIKYLPQRQKILKEFYKDKKPSKKIEEKLLEFFKNCENSKIISLLTGITQIEKEYIVKFFAQGSINEEFLDKYYIELKYYLDDIEFVNNIEWVKDYFKEYKKSKIKNQISTKLEAILKEKNKDRDSFFAWYTDTTFKEINDFEFDKEKILWIDGLGIEWVGIIKNYCLKKGFNCEVFLSKSKLPTTTECNRFENVKKIGLLDDYIHSQSSYNYPKNLVEEIDIIKNILNDYLQSELLIVSDHGFSAFCSFQENKINSFEDEHDGRCARIDKILNDANYFSYDFECGRYIVSLNHISLNNKTKREAHGGATPEEVIVPIIRINKNISQQNQKNKKIVEKKRIGFQEEELF